jgi:hypothetical protein
MKSQLNNYLTLIDDTIQSPPNNILSFGSENDVRPFVYRRSKVNYKTYYDERVFSVHGF